MAQEKPTHYLLPLLFSATLFTSAALLFWIQPLIGKTLLPLFGGSPSVWNTCLLFFQSLLLVGYVYALLLIRLFSVLVQATVHVTLLSLVAIYVFTCGVSSPVLNPAQENPTLALLKTLLLSVGLPFFILSASNPLFQSWFSKARHTLAVDPYFLYSASNAGSLIALVSFPLLLEPSLLLNTQYQLWRVGFVVLTVLTCLIALALNPGTTLASQPKDHGGDPLTAFRRLHWIALAFVPSSLMVGVTTYITADVAAVPLLWVIPLAVYLLTFILAFSKRQVVPPSITNRVMVVGALVVTLILSSGATEPAWALILANLGFFFAAALMCHGQLADDRPPATHLPEFYLWIAIGGALGSVFNVLIAPVLFNSVMEYPLVIVLACMLQGSEAGDNDGRQRSYLDLIYPLGLYALTVSLALLVNQSRLTSAIVKVFIVLGVPLMVINHFLRGRPIRFALSLAAVMLASVYYSGGSERTQLVFRNFFGTTRVTTDSRGAINTLYSGNTVHGRQFLDASRRCEPLSYHHENGPLGQVMAVFNAAPAKPRVAVIGLGVGAMFAYSKPDQEWTFYEIDRDVINLARNSEHFTYLKECAKGSLSVIEGDARLNLQSAPDSHYGLIVLDAFSSDAIPIHLLTKQALDLYLSKLANGGIMAFHISNRSLDLKLILADLAENRNLICIGFDDLKPASFEGKDPSQWVVMARSAAEISNLSINSQWQRLKGNNEARVWTDDYSNIVRAIRWQQ